MTYSTLRISTSRFTKGGRHPFYCSLLIPPLPFAPSTTNSSHHHHRRRKMSSSSSLSPSPTYQKVLTLDTINPNVKNVEYAVRGELSNRAGRYADILSHGKAKENNLSFDSVVTANIGNPQQQPHLAQKPLTFWRQVRNLSFSSSFIHLLPLFSRFLFLFLFLYFPLPLSLFSMALLFPIMFHMR